MPDIGELVPDPGPRREVEANAAVRIYEGVIVSDPADTTEAVMVQIPELDDFVRGPAPWSARFIDGDTYAIPSSGDRAMIALTTNNDPWIVEWWPYE